MVYRYQKFNTITSQFFNFLKKSSRINSLATPTFHDETSGNRLGEPLEEASGPPFEREAATTQSLSET
jgi:hypothetical protein